MIAWPRWPLACVCVIALTAVGCGRSRDRARAADSTITVLYPGFDERALGPYADMPSKFLVFLPLLSLNEKGEPEGRLAERWEFSPDYSTWTVHLRKDVRWHDGVPVTARDIKFTLDLLTHPDVHYHARGAYTIDVLDDQTCTITFNKLAGWPLEEWAWTVCYPKHLLEGLDPKDFMNWEFWTHPVGDGPYRYVRHVPKTMLEVEANPDYYRGKPKIEHVVLKFGALGGLTELLSGNVDAAPVDGTDLLKIAGDRRFQAYYDLGTNDISALILNHRHAPFGNPRVRQALTLAINRRELLQVLNLPPKLPTFDVIFTPRQFWRGELPDPLPYDPELAKRLLEEAGWRDTDGDGVRDHGGKPFRFAALVRPAQGQDKAAVYIQDQLRRVGVQMEVQTLERMQARLLGGKFEAAIYLTNFSGRLGHLKFFGEGSPIGYANGTVSALLKEAWTTQDLDADERRKMDAIYRRLMPIFQADLPLTYLYPACFYTAAHRRVHGLSSPHRADPVWYMEDLWLENRSGQ